MLLPHTKFSHLRILHHPHHFHPYVCNDGCNHRYLQHPTQSNHRTPQYIWPLEIFYKYTIPCTRSKGGSINSDNLSPHDYMYYYLYPSHLTSHTNAFLFPNQITPHPNRQGIASLPNSDPHSSSKIATHCLSSKGDPPLVC